MGHTNIYIRKDNEEEWEHIPNKSDWVNARLGKQESVLSKFVEQLQDAPDEKVAEVVFKQTFCKNGHPIPEGRERCMVKDCKYS